MNSETIRFIDAIARDRNVDRELLLRDLEQAMISAARKHFNSLDTEEFACKVDPISGEITLWQLNEDGSADVFLLRSWGVFLRRLPSRS